MSDTPQIRFDDGAAYESFMGEWSRVAGDRFLDWLRPADGLDWLDVGCGNAAFTERLDARVAPRRLTGIDPSPEQIAYAAERLPAARFVVGDAQALPWEAGAFDATVMALVIFFVPDPARGVAEMARVTRPGGLVCTYAWDLHGGGFPYAALGRALADIGHPLLSPPSADASRPERLEALWRDAGVGELESTTLAIERTFDSLEDWWEIARTGPRVAPVVDRLGAGEHRRLLDDLRARLPADPDGRITVPARAHAIRGRMAT